MLTRRQFLHLVASGVTAEVLLPFCDPALQAEMQDQDFEVHLRKRYTPQSKGFGSGDFGEWITDPNGLPCYHYTCDQVSDPVAVTPVETAWRAPTDQTHQIGNDRILAAASNYGYIQVRQDEGGPKFLNDYQPAAGLFGAGLGYLTDGEELLGTYYPGTGTSFERFFGMGYLRKQTAGKNFSIDQTIYAPFGDDPVLISEVVISSQAPKPTNLLWAEYWGCQLYPFSFQAFVDGHGPGGQLDPDKVVALRRDSARLFTHRFEKLPGGAGLLESKLFQPKPQPPIHVALQEELTADLAILDNASAKQPAIAATTQEPVPPQTFLAPLDEGPVTFLTNATAFFGSANTLQHIGPAGSESVPVPVGVLRPASLVGRVPANAYESNASPGDLSATGPESALILEKLFTLEPGESQTLRFLYGYLPKGFSAADLIAGYRANAPIAFPRSCAAWKEEGIQFTVETDPWVEREVRWHNYYLRSGFTFDDFFGEHIVSQGQTYQYNFGFQGAPRDALQHALPMVFGESRLAKEVLRYTLKSQGPDGALPFAITGHGSPMNFSWRASDLDLWLLWLASEYVLATRDTAFLDERLPTLPFINPDAAYHGGPIHTVREKLDRSYRHLVDTIGTGKHGLLRGLNDDWNDNIYRQGVPKNLGEEVRRESESVTNAAMAAYILDHYARMLRYSGRADGAKDASERAEQQRNAVRAQWAGQWFKRLWLGPGGGWVGGSERLWLDGQPWAIIGDCATPEQRKALIQAIDEHLRQPSKIGAKQVSRKVDWPGFMSGEAENGGVWAALDGPLIWALALSGGAMAPGMAYDEWQKNSRARHADVYPEVWYGIWSGPDVYCSADSFHAGQTGYDWGLVDPEARRRPSNYRGLSWTAWPVMNMHRHAWPLYSAAKLMGIEFTETGVDLAPSIPKPEYSFRSKLLGIEKSAQGYSGWYAPMKTGSYAIRIKLLAEEASSFKTLTVNETAQPAAIQPDGSIQFTGSSTPEKRLSWSLSKAQLGPSL